LLSSACDAARIALVALVRMRKTATNLRHGSGIRAAGNALFA
jgi:hypothetical protein